MDWGSRNNHDFTLSHRPAADRADSLTGNGRGCGPLARNAAAPTVCCPWPVRWHGPAWGPLPSQIRARAHANGLEVFLLSQLHRPHFHPNP